MAAARGFYRSIYTYFKTAAIARSDSVISTGSSAFHSELGFAVTELHFISLSFSERSIMMEACSRGSPRGRSR
jgi:hypothetical protein